jgi:C1A family cysteine protease
LAPHETKGSLRTSTPAKESDTSKPLDKNVENIPESIDWREKGAVNPIVNQEECKSDWAFAVVASIEGGFKIEHDKLYKLSEQ